jgi:hypothetical protein
MTRLTTKCAAWAIVTVAAGAWRVDDVGGCRGDYCAPRILPYDSDTLAVLLQSNAYETLYSVALLKVADGATTLLAGRAALEAAGVDSALSSHSAAPNLSALVLACQSESRGAHKRAGLAWVNATSFRRTDVFGSSNTDDGMSAGTVVLNASCLATVVVHRDGDGGTAVGLTSNPLSPADAHDAWSSSSVEPGMPGDVSRQLPTSFATTSTGEPLALFACGGSSCVCAREARTGASRPPACFDELTQVLSVSAPPPSHTSPSHTRGQPVLITALGALDSGTVQLSSADCFPAANWSFALPVARTRGVGGAVFDRYGRALVFTSADSVDSGVYLVAPADGKVVWQHEWEWGTTSIATVLAVPAAATAATTPAPSPATGSAKAAAGGGRATALPAPGPTPVTGGPPSQPQPPHPTGQPPQPPRPPRPLAVVVDTAGKLHRLDETGKPTGGVIETLQLAAAQLASLRALGAVLLPDGRAVVCGTVGDGVRDAAVQCVATRHLW